MKKRFFPAFLFTLFGLVAVGVLFAVIISGKGPGKAAALDEPRATEPAATVDPAELTPIVFATAVPVTPEPTPVPTDTPKPTATPSPAPETVEVIRRITKAMSEKRDDDVPEIMTELAGIDPVRAEEWRFILDYWNRTETEGFIGGNLLPEGLPDDNSLCLVVFGYQLNSKGKMKAELVGRLETALACARQYPNAYILVTGGGTAADKKDATEAGEMAHWLRKKGIARERILIEDDSTTTGENVKYSYTLLSRHPEITSVAVITSDYHVPRCCLFLNVRFLMKGSPLRVVANASWANGRGVTAEPRKTIADGVAHMYGV